MGTNYLTSFGISLLLHPLKTNPSAYYLIGDRLAHFIFMKVNPSQGLLYLENVYFIVHDYRIRYNYPPSKLGVIIVLHLILLACFKSSSLTF